MIGTKIPPGAFIDCFFPFTEKPGFPGPMRHIAYVQGIVRMRSGEQRLLVMFTTTSPIIIATIPPMLKILIPEASARKMGMRRSFAIDIHRLGLLPSTPEWFPEIAGSAALIGLADSALQEAVTKRYKTMLARNPPPVTVVGP